MEAKKEVTVLGLGQMGVKLAELLVSNGNNVTVWNRTISKAEGLAGVYIQADISMAVAQSNLIVVCVYDYASIVNILESITDKTSLKGKTVINFTTGSPGEAAGMEAWLNEIGAFYLNGALQAAPNQMGLPETTILLSGEKNVYLATEPLLKVFGGNLKYLGDKASAASAVDLATLSWLYGSYIGLIYGVEMCLKTGVKLDTYSDIVGEITPAFTEFFKQQIDTIDSNDFKVTQSPMAISILATRRIRDSFKNLGSDIEFWKSITRLFTKAEQTNLADQELASIVNVIR